MALLRKTAAHSRAVRRRRAAPSENRDEKTRCHHRHRLRDAVGQQRRRTVEPALACESGVGYTSVFDARNFPRDFRRSPQLGHHRRSAKIRSAGNIAAGIAASPPAPRIKRSNEAGIDGNSLDPARFGVYLGCGEGQQDFKHFAEMMIDSLSDGKFDLLRYTRSGMETLHPLAELEQEPNMPAGHLASMFNAQGPNLNCLTACAASSQAVGEAVEIIRRGDADVMLSGGTHSMIHPFGVTGFNLLTALSTRNDEPDAGLAPVRPRPRRLRARRRGRHGGARRARTRQGPRRARFSARWSATAPRPTPIRITDTHPEGRGAVSCMRMALADAQLGVDDIDYINAHGTSTDVNDKVETLAIKTVFGQQAYKIPISSTKSMMGHLIAAAGATELIVCLLAIRDNVLPPTINYETPDPECDLDYIPNTPREARCRRAVTNSFGFGGQNISLVVGQFEG